MKSRKHITLLYIRRSLRVSKMTGYQKTFSTLQQYAILKHIHNVY